MEKALRRAKAKTRAEHAKALRSTLDQANAHASAVNAGPSAASGKLKAGAVLGEDQVDIGVSLRRVARELNREEAYVSKTSLKVNDSTMMIIVL